MLLRSTLKAPFAGLVKLFNALYVVFAKPLRAVPSKKFCTSVGLLVSALSRVVESTDSVPSLATVIPRSARVETVVVPVAGVAT